MPYVVNGIGTWHYGRSRVHELKGQCAACGNYGPLTSFDTTLYFVVFFVPLIPLGKKRILEQCAVCQRHRYMKLADWEKAKGRVLSDLTTALQSGGDKDAAVIEALRAACQFQDEPLFQQVASAASSRPSAAVRTMLGDGYAYFASWAEAEAAYRQALAQEDTPAGHENLAHMLLKQNRPDEALPHLQHILAGADPASAWLIFQTVEAYQAAGRHADALALMDSRDTAFPDVSITPRYMAQRNISVKHAASGKPITQKILSERSSAGYSEGKWWSRGLPRLVGPLVAAGLLIAYLGSAFYIGGHRTIYLVNGSTKPYEIVVAGQKLRLTPEAPTKVVVAEGGVPFATAGTDLGDLPAQIHIETNFWSRPFARHLFVVNPDRLAVLVWEQTEYANKPLNNAAPPRPAADQLLHSFDGVDYEFVPFPGRLNAKKGSRKLKSRVFILPLGSTAARVPIIKDLVPTAKQPDYARQLLRIDPFDGTALAWLTSMLDPAAMLDEARSHLAARPLEPQWHRVYQSISEIVQPNTDLRPEYKKLVEETKRSADALYLLGRIEEEPLAEALYREAVAAVPPSALARSGFAFRLLARGEFEEALSWIKQARDLAPADMLIGVYYRKALIALGQFQTLNDDLASANGWDVMHDRLLARIGLNDPAGADAVIQEYAGQIPPGSPEGGIIRKQIDLTRACMELNQARYLELADAESFEPLLLRGEISKAAAVLANEAEPKAANQRDMVYTVERRGLMCLAAASHGDAKIADEYRGKLVAILVTGDREERNFGEVLAGRKAFNLEAIRTAPMLPESKRVLLAVLATQQSEHAAALRALAEKLNYQRDAISLVLRHLAARQ